MIVPNEVAPTSRSDRWSPGLALLASFLGIGVGFPSVFSSTATAFILPLTRNFGWGRSVPSLMYLAGTGGLALASLVLGDLIARFGAVRVAAFSGTALAIMLGLLSLQHGSAVEAIALCFAAGLLGAGTGAGLWFSVPPRWFDARLGRALGIAAVGQSVGLGLLPALAAAVMERHGWRTAYLALAAIEFVVTLIAVAILWWLALRRREAGVPEPNTTGLEPEEALHRNAFWLLAGSIFLVSAGVIGTSIHLFPLLVDRGVPPAYLPIVALALGMGTLLGRIGSGLALDLVETRIVAALLFLGGGVGVAWLAASSALVGPVSRFGPPLLIGVALGAESDVVAYMSRRLFGMRHLPVIYNRLLIAFYAGAVSGTLAVGWASDHMKSTAAALVTLSASCFLAALLALLLPRTRTL